MADIKLDRIVEIFAERMQYKLNKNKHKDCDKMNADGKGRSWQNCSNQWLLYRLREEVLELEKALFLGGDYGGAPNECADVANFAMMIFDNILNHKP